MTSYILGNLSSRQGFILQGRSPLANLTRENVNSTKCYAPPICLCILGKIGTERLCFIEFYLERVYLLAREKENMKSL